ncbi:hypothetical protein AB0P12_20260 [Streptomyces subrutilus]|uniref:Uncharacterized protein n=1 Tax=Streptomyces subrutilus TaxID=36818 RepID=A0A5P2ULZ5_9ACTN|nr:hypothetical protein [Streptomyces subrutilus]QEU79355.1 hypothetical protein CP968_14445 [Streptomyces subrutilus]WSJ31448.1 hypothetical protein OG479_20395 [Streptomyces subrutilus]GGZ53944.1 hypothetical protein GCM10010371_11890 [Streptomyces subrutilus]
MPVRRLKTALACTAAASLCLAALAPAAHGVDGPAPDPRNRQAMRDMATAMRVTAKYVDERAALRDGYVPHGESCMNNPFGAGAMGYHYVKQANWGSKDPARPTALLYSREKDRNGRRTLQTVEWMSTDRDQDLKTTDDRPTMFGLPFDGPMPGHWAGMPKHYDLHMWAYKENPAGRFHNWNPALTCPGKKPAPAHPDPEHAHGH